MRGKQSEQSVARLGKIRRIHCWKIAMATAIRTEELCQPPFPALVVLHVAERLALALGDPEGESLDAPFLAQPLGFALPPTRALPGYLRQDAAMADRLATIEARRLPARLDLVAPVALGLADRANPADVGDDAREHAIASLQRRPEHRPNRADRARARRSVRAEDGYRIAS